MNKSISPRVLTLFPMVLVCYEIANYLSNDAYLPALPTIAKELHVSNHLVQLTLTAFFLGNATMQLILGPVSERYGRRPVLLFGGVVFTLATFACAFTHNITMLLIARFIQGSAVTSMIISGYGTIHAMYDQHRAIKTLAWMNSITVLAPALGPLVGAMILLFADWRWIFVILGIWAIAALAILFKMMPETCEEHASLHPVHILKQYWSVVSDWGFAQPILALSLLFGAMIAWIAAGPFLVMDVFHYSAQMFGVMQVLVFGSFIAGTRCVSPLMNRVGPKKLIRLSVILAVIAGCLSLALSIIIPNQLADIVVPMMLLSFGSGIGFPIFNRVGIEASTQPMGIKMAIFASAMSWSALVGSIMISSFYDGKVISFAIIIFLFSVLAIVIGYGTKVKPAAD